MAYANKFILAGYNTFLCCYKIAKFANCYNKPETYMNQQEKRNPSTRGKKNVSYDVMCKYHSSLHHTALISRLLTFWLIKLWLF